MRCLWITRQDPRPANSGELIYSHGLLRALATTKGLELHALAHGGARGKSPDADAGIRWHLTGPPPPKRLLGVFSHLPGDADRLGNPPMRAALRRLLAEKPWDWVIIDQAACGWALDEIPSGSHARIAYIAHNHEAGLRRMVASHDGGSAVLKVALKADAAKYARLENRLVTRADLVTAITPRDADEFRRSHPGCRILVLPPGFEGEIPPSDPAPIDDSTPRRVVLAGTFQWIAKRRNLEEFLAAAAAPFQAAKIAFVVAGKADPAYFERLAKLHPWASFHANVPSMEPFLKGVRIGLIPEALGGGFKLKALDYIFRGLPLASIDAALSGLPLDPERDTITASDPASLATAVVGKIDALDFLNQAARSALAKCRRSFDWADRGTSLADALIHSPQSTPNPSRP
jgi:glycosyltransferase involved in cell wall biosynthesis